MDIIEQTDAIDLATGIPSSDLADGQMIEGQVGGEPVLLARSGGAAFAIGGRCTHYAARLADGLLVDDTVRCPLHHACFSLRTGDALCAPALAPLPTYSVTETDGILRVGAKRAAQVPPPAQRPDVSVRTVIIVGTGAAGAAAAEMLRRSGFDGRLMMIGAEPDLPYDRPNLSKDFLAGTAPDEWLPLRSRNFYEENEIELVLGQRVSVLDVEARELRMLSGRSPKFDRLLLATGAEAVRLPIATHALRHVFTLRSLADTRAVIAAAAGAKRAVVVGSSFIALEASAALRARGIAVDVVAQRRAPFENVFGPALSRFIQRLHESHGVTFHLNESVRAIDETHVTLTNSATLPADLVVVGIGVRPAVALAQWAKLDVADGILVDQYLETSRAGIYAAGDVACWLDAATGTRRRVEHWAVAERQGQTAARNMLGGRLPFTTVPFFWSVHYDVTIRYVGHHDAWDEIVIDGDLEARDCTVEYRQGGRMVAVATVGRDRDSLRAEVAFERAAARELEPAATAG